MIELQAVAQIQHLALATWWSRELAVFLARWSIYLNVILAAVLLTSGRKKEIHGVVEAAWSAALALVLTTLLAFLIQRVRPYLASSDVALLIPAPLNTSFPSGHTATAVAIAVAFWMTRRDLGLWSCAVAALVAMGRMAVGVHYPSDILGGIGVGLISYGIVNLIHQQLHRRDLPRQPRGKPKAT